MLSKEIRDSILRALILKKQKEKVKYFTYLFSFVANLFNTYPALDLPIEHAPEPGIVIEETREEKTYRNFINSLGIEPHVNYLYSDLCDGLIILQVILILRNELSKKEKTFQYLFFKLYDVIHPNTVDWSKIYKTFNVIKEHFQKLSNYFPLVLFNH